MTGHYAVSKEDALKLALSLIPEDSSVTMGGSMSAHEIGLVDAQKNGKYNFIDDRAFENKDHDHIGIILEKRERTILAAEGNVNNVSEIIECSVDDHIRAYIRIPDGYQYKAEGDTQFCIDR